MNERITEMSCIIFSYLRYNVFCGFFIALSVIEFPVILPYFFLLLLKFLSEISLQHLCIDIKRTTYDGPRFSQHFTFYFDFSNNNRSENRLNGDKSKEKMKVQDAQNESTNYILGYSFLPVRMMCEFGGESRIGFHPAIVTSLIALLSPLSCARVCVCVWYFPRFNFMHLTWIARNKNWIQTICKSVNHFLKTFKLRHQLLALNNLFLRDVCSSSFSISFISVPFTLRQSFLGPFFAIDNSFFSCHKHLP